MNAKIEDRMSVSIGEDGMTVYRDLVTLCSRYGCQFRLAVYPNGYSISLFRDGVSVGGGANVPPTELFAALGVSH